MDWGAALVKTVRPHGLKTPARSRRRPRSGPLAAAVFLVTTLISVAASGVPGQWHWGPVSIAVALGVLICAGMALKWLESRSQPGPAGVALAPEDDFGRGSAAYGVPRFIAGARGMPGQLLSTVMPIAYAESPAGSTETGPVINLVHERHELVRVLNADRSNVILVHGPPGAGKTTLVSSVLRETGQEAEVRLHDLAPGDLLDAKALLDDIKSGPEAGAALAPGVDLLGCLEAELDVPDSSPVIVVIDGAQSLITPTNRMNDSGLAEALELIASGRQRRVKVILIVQEHPSLERGGSWHRTADRVFVGGLPRRDFYAFLKGLDPASGFGLTDRATIGVGRLYDVLQGNPRLAEMFRAAVGLSENRPGAGDLERQLARVPPAEREARLASIIVDHLSTDQRRIVVALAAYGTPVTIKQVSDLLKNDLMAAEPSNGQTDALAPEQVEALVPGLVNWGVIGKAPARKGEPSARYYVRVPGIVQELSKDLSARVLWAAVEQVTLDPVSMKGIQKPEELSGHFAKLDIMLREARVDKFDDPAGALYAEINKIETEMERVLRQSKAAGMLLKYREAIRDRRRSCPDREMANSSALGRIYLARGRFTEARQAFEDAREAFGKVQQQADAGSSGSWRKILLDLAALSWNTGDTSEAVEYYSKAGGGFNAESDDKLDLVTAEDGLADCYRRRGNLDAAIQHGEDAYDNAQAIPRLSVDIAVKLARWRSELGQVKRKPGQDECQQDQRQDAKQLMREAGRAAEGDPALLLHCLAGRAGLLLDRADLLLAAGHFRRARHVTGRALAYGARHVARQALKRALELHDEVTVRQASTTLAMADLLLGNIPAAQREIDRAARCRRAGWSLDVLALQALIAFETDPEGEKAKGHFAELKREADQRLTRDKKDDFAAWGFKGLAICGMTVGGTASLPKEAMDAFRQTRGDAFPPVLRAQLKQWLEILQKKDTDGQLHQVISLVTGTAAPQPS